MIYRGLVPVYSIKGHLSPNEATQTKVNTPVLSLFERKDIVLILSRSNAISIPWYIPGRFGNEYLTARQVPDAARRFSILAEFNRASQSVWERGRG